MAKLTAISAAQGLVPATIGAATLDEVTPNSITSVAPLNGAERAVSKALKSKLGAGFPAPGRTTAGKDARVIWSGRGQALVIGKRPGDLSEMAALSDQSDAWTVLSLVGPDVRHVLARLTPLDLRPVNFGTGQTARSSLGHMMAVFTATGDESFEIMVMRSMTQSAIHEISGAMERVAAKAAL